MRCCLILGPSKVQCPQLMAGVMGSLEVPCVEATAGKGGVRGDKAPGLSGSASPINDGFCQLHIFQGLAQVQQRFQLFLQDEFVLGQLLFQVSEIDFWKKAQGGGNQDGWDGEDAELRERKLAIAHCKEVSRAICVMASR